MRSIKRPAAMLALVLAVGAALFVADQAIQTLRILTLVERERDTWQRPDEIIRQLNLAPGNTVVDLGSGAGYFALKIAPLVTPGGRVIAVDLRRQSLAFLWIRAARDGYRPVEIVRGQVSDPRLPAGTIDAALIANTFHELSAPEPILKKLFDSMRKHGRLVVVDRAPRGGDASVTGSTADHEITAAVAEREITAQGFEAVARDDRFIDRPEDEDVWWLIVFTKP
jgi:ubiquinone/menaquinone biosynthesis C-methylase UbiE